MSAFTASRSASAPRVGLVSQRRRLTRSACPRRLTRSACAQAPAPSAEAKNPQRSHDHAPAVLPQPQRRACSGALPASCSIRISGLLSDSAAPRCRATLGAALVWAPRHAASAASAELGGTQALTRCAPLRCGPRRVSGALAATFCAHLTASCHYNSSFVSAAVKAHPSERSAQLRARFTAAQSDTALAQRGGTTQPARVPARKRGLQLRLRRKRPPKPSAFSTTRVAAPPAPLAPSSARAGAHHAACRRAPATKASQKRPSPALSHVSTAPRLAPSRPGSRCEPHHAACAASSQLLGAAVAAAQPCACAVRKPPDARVPLLRSQLRSQLRSLLPRVAASAPAAPDGARRAACAGNCAPRRPLASKRLAVPATAAAARRRSSADGCIRRRSAGCFCRGLPVKPFTADETSNGC